MNLNKLKPAWEQYKWANGQMPIHEDEVMAMLDRLKSDGVTILMVTHSPEHGQRADRIIEMLDGEVVGGDSSAPLSVVADNTEKLESKESQA